MDKVNYLNIAFDDLHLFLVGEACMLNDILNYCDMQAEGNYLSLNRILDRAAMHGVWGRIQGKTLFAKIVAIPYNQILRRRGIWLDKIHWMQALLIIDKEKAIGEFGFTETEIEIARNDPFWKGKFVTERV